MKGGDGFLQGYNAQAAVEGVCQLIVGQTVTQAANDKEQLQPLLQAVEQQAGQRPAEVLADSGYCSEQNLESLESAAEPEKQIEAYIATRKGPARAASAAREARTLAAGSDAGGADEAQVADAGRSDGLRPTQVDRRAGVWPDQTGAWDARVSLPRVGEGARGMGLDLPDAQHIEDAHALLWIVTDSGKEMRLKEMGKGLSKA